MFYKIEIQIKLARRNFQVSSDLVKINEQVAFPNADFKIFKLIRYDFSFMDFAYMFIINAKLV